jgi:hypothetical protein
MLKIDWTSTNGVEVFGVARVGDTAYELLVWPSVIGPCWLWSINADAEADDPDHVGGSTTTLEEAQESAAQALWKRLSAHQRLQVLHARRCRDDTAETAGSSPNLTVATPSSPSTVPTCAKPE